MESFSSLVIQLFSKHKQVTSTSTDTPPVQLQWARFDSFTPSPSSTGKSSTSGISSEESSQAGVFRISSIKSDGNGGGPAFAGKTFSIGDLSGPRLLGEISNFDTPFLYKSSPEWLKKIFSLIVKNERKGPPFRFFTDFSDAVSYLKKLNISSSVVCAVPLDFAYELFREKQHLFQFVPNERQVKAANNLLRQCSWSSLKKVDGVPVFSSENLEVAMATSNGIKWYSPYFFDKAMLDNILENSTDQHFHGLIQSRHIQRRRDSVGMEEANDSMIEPPEVQEVMDEMGHPRIPLSVVSKVAEIELFYAIDNLLLGNRWLRKAIGIQPKYPYMVDTFERRSTISSREPDFLRKVEPFTHRLPKITLLGIWPGDDSYVTKACMKKAMEDLTEELEQIDDKHRTNDRSSVERDPLFIASELRDYKSGITKVAAPRWNSGKGN